MQQTGQGYNNLNPTCKSSNIAGGSCTGWDPDEEVTLISGVRYMDWQFVYGLTQDSSPIIICDDGVLVPLEGGGFQLTGASTRDLAYALGLRNNDIPLSLNDMPLETITDVFDALHELYFDEGETDYELDVYRNSSTITLHYHLDVSSP